MSENSNKLSIMVEVGMPSPETRKHKYLKPECKKTVEEKVRNLLELIDSGYDSDVEFITIKKLYADLCRKPQNARVKNLKKMIEPVLAKYGYHTGTRES